jgi:hypothetical protein
MRPVGEATPSRGGADTGFILLILIALEPEPSGHPRPLSPIREWRSLDELERLLDQDLAGHLAE